MALENASDEYQRIVAQQTDSASKTRDQELQKTHYMQNNQRGTSQATSVKGRYHRCPEFLRKTERLNRSTMHLRPNAYHHMIDDQYQAKRQDKKIISKRQST